MPTTNVFEAIKAQSRKELELRIENELKLWHRGREKRIEKWELVSKVFDVTFPEESRNANNPFERSMRLAISDMRKAGKPICADSAGGYWWAGTIDEVLSTAAELECRAKDLFETASAIKAEGFREFGGQGKLL